LNTPNRLFSSYHRQVRRDKLPAIIEICVINGIQGGTLKPWPELVEGLFGGGLASLVSVKAEAVAGSVNF